MHIETRVSERIFGDFSKTAIRKFSESFQILNEDLLKNCWRYLIVPRRWTF